MMRPGMVIRHHMSPIEGSKPQIVEESRLVFELYYPVLLSCTC